MNKLNRSSTSLILPYSGLLRCYLPRTESTQPNSEYSVEFSFIQSRISSLWKFTGEIYRVILSRIKNNNDGGRVVQEQRGDSSGLSDISQDTAQRGR